MKKHHLAASLLGIYLSTACSNGEFDLSRNRYHNVFGVFLTPPNIGKGGFLGRFTTEEGRPIAGARIYLGNERAGITNEKGGFYIGDLTVGKKQIYLVQSEQKMAAISVDIEANKISESEYIRSLPTLSIKGHVSLADEVFLEGSSITAINSPFLAITDAEGSYYMNVPEGTYRLQVSSRFTHYSGQLTEPIEIKDDLDMDFSLQRHPYPAGKVSIATDSDNLVRDSMVHLTVETLPGVQYMKVITEQNFEILEDYPLDRWIPVQKSFVFAAKEFGHHRLFFWFQDNNGKISDLIQVSFFRTHFDKSWHIIRGVVEKDFTIHANEKIAFIPTYLDVVESGATTTETAEEQDTIAIETSEANLPIKIDHNINWALSDTIPTDTQITTISSKKQVSNSTIIRQNVIFRGNVTIKAGAYIVGAAEFRKNVYLQGKKERPIHWSSSDNGINEIGFYTPTFVLGNLNSEHTIFENLLLQGLANHKNTEYSFSNTSFRNSLVDFLHEAGLSLKFMHSELHNTAASIYCHIYDSEASSKHSEDSNIPETSESLKSPSTTRRWIQGPKILEFYLTDSTLNESSIDFSCPEYPQSEINSKLIITGNNFFKNRDDSYYFLNRFNDFAGLNTDSPTGSQYTSQNSENVTIQNNYFQFSNRIASKLDPSNWPETIGANLESPNTSAGVE